MPQLTDAKIAELKTAHKDLVCIEIGGHQLVFRKPKRLEFDQWLDSTATKSQAALALSQQCLVFPTPQEYMAVIEEYPAVVSCKAGIVDTVTDLAGADGGVSAKKL